MKTEVGHEVYLSVEHWTPFHPQGLNWKQYTEWEWDEWLWLAPGPVSTGCLTLTGFILNARVISLISDAFLLRTSVELCMDWKLCTCFSFLRLVRYWNDDAPLYWSDFTGSQHLTNTTWIYLTLKIKITQVLLAEI